MVILPAGNAAGKSNPMRPKAAPEVVWAKEPMALGGSKRAARAAAAFLGSVAGPHK